MNVSLTLPESIVDWANTQEDIQKAILDVLEKHVLSLNPAAINAIKLLKKFSHTSKGNGISNSADNRY